MPTTNYGNEFESYLVSALNDSLIRKSKSQQKQIKSISNKWPFHQENNFWRLKKTSKEFIGTLTCLDQVALSVIFLISIIIIHWMSNLQFFFSLCRLDKEFVVHVMVGRERWEEQYHRCFPIGWVATWDYHQGHQVLRQGALQCRQAQYNAAGMLGSVCRRLSWRLRQGYGPQASWSEDSRVEQILRIVPHRDEKHIRWGAQKVREEGTGPMADQVAHER